MKKTIRLRAHAIEKSFPGTKALDKVDFELFEGEVHAIVGENGAGKTTLMNIFSGVLSPDSGNIFLNDKTVKFQNPRDAQEAGIAFVHQELAVCPDVSVAENIFLGRIMSNKVGIVDYKEMYKKAQELLEPFKCSIDPSAKIKRLNIAEQQIIEIARALSLNCKILILDEPTSSLTESETAVLFEIINNIRRKNISVLYISHKMDEIFRLSDRITILRDGRVIDTVNSADITENEVLYKMVGRHISDLYPSKGKPQDEYILEVKDFSNRFNFEDISFFLKKNEILGMAGLIGAGRTEIAKAICGIDKFEKGEVFIHGRQVKIRNFKDAIRKGIAYLTEDRKGQGLFQNLSVKNNVTCTCIEKVSGKIVVNKHKEKEWAENYVKKLNIKLSDVQEKINNLSGGNQQKIMISKWLSVEPKILILDEPTRGIDVGAKAEIHGLLRELANQGIGIIIISSELPEIIGMCDRVLVIKNGRISGELQHDEINEKKIITIA